MYAYCILCLKLKTCRRSLVSLLFLTKIPTFALLFHRRAVESLCLLEVTFILVKTFTVMQANFANFFV